MRKPANIFLLAILIGALSAAMVYRHLRRQQAELEAARNNAQGVVEAVLVAAQPIPIGSQINKDQVRLVRWPSDALPEGAVADPDRVVGHVARVNIQKNQPLSESLLTEEGSGLLPLLISDGMRAMSVKVDKVTGVSGFITPNSRVDVLIAGIVESGPQREQRSKLILQNVTVLAIGTNIELQDDKPVEVPMVTLLVSPEEAEKLTLAARHEPVRLALRNYRDEEEVTTPGISADQLFALGKSNGAPKRRKAGPPARPSVEILLGETRTRQAY